MHQGALPVTEDDPLSALMARVAAQDRAAFRALYAASSAKLHGVLLRILGNRAEAEEALQETYTRIWLRAGRFDPAKGRAMTWMIAVTRNLAIDRLRARTPDRAGDDDGAVDSLPDGAAGALDRLVAQGEARRVIDCMAQLEPDRAQAVRGAYLAGLSYEQLAQRHGVPINTMRTWLRRSLIRLRECLGA